MTPNHPTTRTPSGRSNARKATAGRTQPQPETIIERAFDVAAGLYNDRTPYFRREYRAKWDAAAAIARLIGGDK